MKAAVLHEFKGIKSISIDEIAAPTPKPHQVQIKVHYAGINPVDWKIAEGRFKERIEHRFPITPGWDVSGTISALGKDVTTSNVGDHVFAFCFEGNVIHQGAYAEYVCFDAQHVVLKPKSLSFAEAAAVPLAALTAWQAIHDHMTLKPRDKILIQAGAGGVGGFAIQFAKNKGAYVITTTSSKNINYVADFGADEIIDYKKAPFEKQIKENYSEKLDIIFDTVGGESLNKSLPLLKKGGQLVTIAGVVDPNSAKNLGILSKWFMLKANGKQLAEIGSLLATDKLKLPDIKVIPFEDFESALHQSCEGHVRGKLVLELPV